MKKVEQKGRVAVFISSDKKTLTGKATFEQRFEGGRGKKHASDW